METHQDSEQKKFDMNTIRVLADAVTHAIGESEGDKRFIDLKRVPLICLSITKMHEDIKEIKDMIKETHGKFVTHESFNPIKSIVYGVVGLALTTVVIAGLSMVIRQ